MNDDYENTLDDSKGALASAGKMTHRKQVRLLDDVRVEDLALVISQSPPPPKKMTPNDLLDALAPRLREAVQRGHNPASLAALLQGQGVNVTHRNVAKTLRKSQLGSVRSARQRAAKQRKNVS